MQWRPKSAMILGAGLGTRMRPLTETKPKPMVEFKGKPLVDHILDRLKNSGFSDVVINVHYLPDILENHLKERAGLNIFFSDERAELLDTGGGVKKALHLLGDDAFLIHNSDSLSHEPNVANLDKLIAQWNGDEMDTLLLLAPLPDSLGYSGNGDFNLSQDGRVGRPIPGETADFVFTGVSIAHPRMFLGAPTGAFSLNRLWTKAIEHGRAYGVLHQGLWMHIGTPGALLEAEKASS